VAFISKKLVKSQLAWTVPEKEAYAIYYAFRKLDYLIRDVRFVLQTDHKNLTFINDDTSAKIRRWKMFLLEFMCDIEHIPGKTNIIADGFSRFVHFPEKEEKKNIEREDIDFSETILAGLIDPFELPQKYHNMIAKVHNSNVGHFGVDRTYEKCKKAHGVWEYMREHIKAFIRKCPCCQKMSRLKIPIHTHPFTTAAYAVFERVAIDTIGPLPEDVDGNRYIIVIIDCFSRYLKLYPAKSVDAVSAVKALLQWVGTFGPPSQIISDNGSQYVNQLIDEFLKVIGTEHVLTMAYSKEENAIVERVNKEVMRHLRAILFEKGLKDKWSWVYPLVERIINSEVHETIRVSPAQLVFGNMIDLDRGLCLPHEVVNRKQSKYSECTSKL